MMFARMVPPSGTANRTRQRAGRRCLPAAVPCATIAAACELNGMGVENGDGGPRWEQLSAPDAKRGGVRFHFRALGPIKEAELELSGLTILAGRNNTGKTWLATALYGSHAMARLGRCSSGVVRQPRTCRRAGFLRDGRNARNRPTGGSRSRTSTRNARSCLTRWRRLTRSVTLTASWVLRWELSQTHLSGSNCRPEGWPVRCPRFRCGRWLQIRNPAQWRCDFGRAGGRHPDRRGRSGS